MPPTGQPSRLAMRTEKPSDEMTTRSPPQPAAVPGTHTPVTGSRYSMIEYMPVDTSQSPRGIGNSWPGAKHSWLVGVSYGDCASSVGYRFCGSARPTPGPLRGPVIHLSL